MKLKFISMAVFSALTLGVATNASAVTTVNGGTVHFKGDVVDAACAVIQQIKRFCWGKFVQLSWRMMERRVPLLDLVLNLMTVVLQLPGMHQLSLQEMLLLHTMMCCLYRIVLQVVQQM